MLAELGLPELGLVGVEDPGIPWLFQKAEHSVHEGAVDVRILL